MSPLLLSKVVNGALTEGQVVFRIPNPKIVQNYPPQNRLGWTGESTQAEWSLFLENWRLEGSIQSVCFPQAGSFQEKENEGGARLHSPFQIHKARLLLQGGVSR